MVCRVSAASSARSGRATQTPLLAAVHWEYSRHLVSLYPPSKHTLSIVPPLVLRQVSCRSLTERGFQKSAKLQRRNISWKACGGAQASKHRPCSPNHHRCGNFVTIIHAIITDFGKSACGPCYGGACLRKFAAPTAGPGRMGQLAKNALETSRYENENMRSAKSILDLPVVYRHSASGPPAASRQRLE